jgi:hypothetical protein
MAFTSTRHRTNFTAPQLLRYAVVRQIFSLAIAVLLAGCSPPAPNGRQLNSENSKTLDDQTAQRAAATENAQLKADCQKEIESHKQKFKILMAAHSYWGATLELRDCANALEDKTLQIMVADAEFKFHLQGINDLRTMPRDRVIALERLLHDHPDKEKEYGPLLARLRINVDKAQEAAITELQTLISKQEATSRKREGVRIGMTGKEVIASRWGRPNSVNRTTFASGIQEQWVYSNGNYLYFENGKLTAIQD